MSVSRDAFTFSGTSELLSIKLELT